MSKQPSYIQDLKDLPSRLSIYHFRRLASLTRPRLLSPIKGKYNIYDENSF
ncbi:hypothetical protein [Simkania sp.]|uniref:hypothetical protein n=1 Tax=Simkania sp. TaxID=34094 RepID=UPI003B5292BB